MFIEILNDASKNVWWCPVMKKPQTTLVVTRKGQLPDRHEYPPKYSF
ncbi:unnamed protein product [Acanthoscelides obtectus]|uniref:Uncharacterized protein n=1 Tax=Acanthoscelides obtectus TaxID=200917 RepID=A0A9P0KJ49_ACAOB|nr:unnamed protein product [Acanthoscelides obtectus]CAK1644771.1 hypothetical protein AOBTE_LOCUS13935 [Acanthoscelides obtectus]